MCMRLRKLKPGCGSFAATESIFALSFRVKAAFVATLPSTRIAGEPGFAARTSAASFDLAPSLLGWPVATRTLVSKKQVVPSADSVLPFFLSSSKGICFVGEGSLLGGSPGSDSGYRRRRFRCTHHAGDIGYGFAGNGRWPFPRHHDAYQVQRIGRRNRHRTVGPVVLCAFRAMTRLPRQGKLFPAKPVDEAAAAHRPSRFQTAEHTQQLTPARHSRLALEQIAKDHAIAPQEHAACGLDLGLLTLDLAFRAPASSAAGSLPNLSDRDSSKSGLSRPQRPAAVRGRLTVLIAPWKTALRRGSMSTRRLSKPSAVARPAATSSHRARFTCSAGAPRPRTRSPAKIAPCRARQECTRQANSLKQAWSISWGIFAPGRGIDPSIAHLRARKRLLGATLVGTTRLGPENSPFCEKEGWMRRDPAPTYNTLQAQAIQPPRVVSGDTLGKERSFPLDGRRFKALQQAQRLEHAHLSGELALRSHTLPAQQPLHVDRGRDWLDLPAQASQRLLVDALQDAALAPLHILIAGHIARSLKAPRRMVPCISSASIVRQIDDGSIPSRCPKARDVTGPSIAIHPCTVCRKTSSGSSSFGWSWARERPFEIDAWPQDAQVRDPFRGYRVFGAPVPRRRAGPP